MFKPESFPQQPETRPEGRLSIGAMQILKRIKQIDRQLGELSLTEQENFVQGSIRERELLKKSPDGPAKQLIEISRQLGTKVAENPDKFLEN